MACALLFALGPLHTRCEDQAACAFGHCARPLGYQPLWWSRCLRRILPFALSMPEATAIIQVHLEEMKLYDVTFSLWVFSELYILKGDYPVRICNFYRKMVFSYKNVRNGCFVLKTQKAYKICKFSLFYYICVCFSHKSVLVVLF